MTPTEDREIDALIAEKVFGWEKIPGTRTDRYGSHQQLFKVGTGYDSAPFYTTNAADSKALEKRLIEMDWWPSMTYRGGIWADDRDKAGYEYHLRSMKDHGPTGDVTAYHVELEMARALCALKAIGVEL